MSAEIELKLDVTAMQVPALLAWLEQEAGAAKQRSLRNIYLDTPSLDLHRQRAALRLREIQRDGASQWVQTLKTAGHSIDGLAVRGEWECAIDGTALDIQRFPVAAQAFLDRLSAHPIPIFRTDFLRRTWQVAVPNGMVEVALDEGAVRLLDNYADIALPICELELEWQNNHASTDTASTCLRSLATRLGTVSTFTPSNISKAERGYRLYVEHHSA